RFNKGFRRPTRRPGCYSVAGSAGQEKNGESVMKKSTFYKLASVAFVLINGAIVFGIYLVI
ncbi:MAG: hypothetical protein ACRCSS_11835, partial [Shewanella sp.]